MSTTNCATKETSVLFSSLLIELHCELLSFGLLNERIFPNGKHFRNHFQKWKGFKFEEWSTSRPSNARLNSFEFFLIECVDSALLRYCKFQYSLDAKNELQTLFAGPKSRALPANGIHFWFRGLLAKIWTVQLWTHTNTPFGRLMRISLWTCSNSRCCWCQTERHKNKTRNKNN